MADTATEPAIARKDELLQVSRVAANLLDYQFQIKAAHDLGVPRGRCKEPWGLEWHRQTMPTIAKTMPDQWIEGLGRVSADTAEIMHSHDLGGGYCPYWELVMVYLGNLGTAVTEFFGLEVIDFDGDRSNPPPIPSVMPYDEIAAGVDPAGTAQMIVAAASVRAYSLRAAYGVTIEEIEWLRGFAGGERGLDIGHRFGYSERDFYRAQQRLWEKLTVDGRNEALVLSAEFGWISTQAT